MDSQTEKQLSDRAVTSLSIIDAGQAPLPDAHSSERADG